MAKRIVLAGGSGFVGQALAASFLADGYEIHILSRGTASTKLLGTVVPWDGATLGAWTESLEDAAAVINLTGKSTMAVIDKASCPAHRDLSEGMTVHCTVTVSGSKVPYRVKLTNVHDDPVSVPAELVVLLRVGVLAEPAR